MKIQLPNDVNDIINLLASHGYEAFAVGGCIRDSILGLKPEDWDITTSAKPNEVKKVFRRTVDTGIEHGTVTVLIGNNSYEVTTYRIDGEYVDNRHPTSVEFTSDLANDLMRRDFTINAMAYNEHDGLVDLFGGIKDLEKGIIRCVGNPIHRFEEDALRILRAFRFSAQLNFNIEEETYQAACNKKENLKNISAERIRTELNKLIISHHPERLIDLYDAGITKIILREFDTLMETRHPILDESLGTYTIRTLQALDKLIEDNKEIVLSKKLNLSTRWTLVLHQLKTKEANSQDNRSKNPAKGVLRKLKFDNETIDKTCRLINWIDISFTLSDYGMRKAINQIGKDLIEALFIVKLARIKAFPAYVNIESQADLLRAWDIYKSIVGRGDCTDLSMLDINGKDLIALGYKPGKSLGNTLDYLLDQVLEDPSLNHKNILEELARKYLR
ncbi:MAG: CCA tRNA nucleotidyltransferase [Clostridiales bacterium]|nr:CCA tRNA nucleotidyltransferase [Clostridiales bacterium]